MTEEQGNNEAAIWDQVLDLIPAPFRGRVVVLENAVVFYSCRAATARILASINRRRDGYENDVVIPNRWPLRPIPLKPDSAERIACVLVERAFETVLSSLPLAVTPPLELDDAWEHICWAPSGERLVALARFKGIADLKWYAERITGFKYRVHLADFLSGAVNHRSSKNDASVALERGRARVRRKDRTVVIHGDEPMASILLRGGRYGDEGRTVAGADYGALRDEDLLAPAVSFLCFEGD